MNKRLFLLVVIIVMMGGGAFLLLRPNPQKQMDKALTHVSKGQYAEADALLASYPLPVYTSLYRGYIEQKRGRFEIAERYLKAAAKEAKRGFPRELQSEIALAHAANAFCKGSHPDFCTYLQMARTLNRDSVKLPFFEGLEHYLSGNYSETLQFWNSQAHKDCESWMEASLDSIFTSSWKKLHIAHCLIEVGDFTASREIIEKESRMASIDQESLPLATLILGLSYLKEGAQVPLEQRGSYYKLARFYFDRVKSNARLSHEKEKTIAHIEQEAEHLIFAKLNSDQHKWGFDFIHLLQDWKAEGPIERLAERLALSLLHHKGETSIRQCADIREQFHGSPFHLLLTEKMLAALSREVKAGEAEDLFTLWAHVEQLAPSPLMAAKRVAALTSDEIFETIKKDTISLTRTLNFLAFWEKLGRTPFEREVLARDLLIHAKTFWYYEQQEKKGQHLMEVALHLSQRNSYIEQEITTFLTTLFKQAESSNMIGRLLIVYEAMGNFDMNRQELVSKATLANYLADAEYLYQAHNYIAAKTHAGWVLKLDPQNEGALRLAGLAAFQLGEYGQALVHLQQVDVHNEATQQALMLSQVFASQDQAKHLCQTDPTGNYETNE